MTSCRSIIFAVLFTVWCKASFAQETMHPNVLLILTDDQGFGDLGINGNKVIQTPVIDRLARESIRFNNFYVSPVCAPTRASLMTGRYSLRTGIRDTYNGGAIMATEEVTIAEVLKAAHYKTGVFGKWHLGDNYPSRPNDQGFDEALVHLSGGMGQVGDFTTYFKGDSSYFNPILWHNGHKQIYNGYCSDIFADNAIEFIQKNRDSQFFCYLAFNAPHTPLQLPDKYYQKYKGLNPEPELGSPTGLDREMTEGEKEDTRKIYGMVSNIDDNIGRVLEKLESLNLVKNTIVIFMTDNGPQQFRFNAGMRGLKGSVYDGGIRVPFLLRYPSFFKDSKQINGVAAHIDVFPTLARLCHVKLPAATKIDGKNLVPLIEGELKDWSARTLFFYWTRRYPELYNNMAIQKGDIKLVSHTNYESKTENLELFDILRDPKEQFNLVSTRSGIATALKSELEHITEELVNSPHLVNAPRIIIGSRQENPVFLNRNDADGEPGIWAQEEIYGFWKVKIFEGNYTIRFKFIKPVKGGGQMSLETGTFINQMHNDLPVTDEITFQNIHLPKIECDFRPCYTVGTQKIFPFVVEIEKI